jgi:hypothetical protein
MARMSNTDERYARRIFDLMVQPRKDANGNVVDNRDDLFEQYKKQFIDTETIAGGIDDNGRIIMESQKNSVNYTRMLESMNQYTGGIDLTDERLKIWQDNGKLYVNSGQHNIDIIAKNAAGARANSNIRKSIDKWNQDNIWDPISEADATPEPPIAKPKYEPKINKGEQKIKDLINNPGLLLDEKPQRQRHLADIAYQQSNRAGFVRGEMPKFMDRVSELSLTDNDFLFNIDASDEIISDTYNTVNKNKKWQDAYIRKQYDAGAYSSAFDFKAKKASDLTADQMELLRENFRENELKKFNDAFETVTEKEVTSKGIKKGKPIKTKEEVRSFSVAGARRNYMKREIFNGVDPTSKEFADAIDRAMEKVPDGGTTGRQVDALIAYRDYAKKAYEKADTTRVMKAKDFMTENFGKTDAEAAHKLLKNELKGLGHDGIKASSKLKGLKVAGGIAAGLTALWAAGEIWDE